MNIQKLRDNHTQEKLDEEIIGAKHEEKGEHQYIDSVRYGNHG